MMLKQRSLIDRATEAFLEIVEANPDQFDFSVEHIAAHIWGDELVTEGMCHDLSRVLSKIMKAAQAKTGKALALIDRKAATTTANVMPDNDSEARMRLPRKAHKPWGIHIGQEGPDDDLIIKAAVELPCRSSWGVLKSQASRLEKAMASRAICGETARELVLRQESGLPTLEDREEEGAA